MVLFYHLTLKTYPKIIRAAFLNACGSFAAKGTQNSEPSQNFG
jgi:hypothetical protein